MKRRRAPTAELRVFNVENHTTANPPPRPPAGQDEREDVMSEHTKGPWTTAGDGYSITTSDRKAMYVAQVHPFDPMGKANARLIAASPIMYDYVVQKAHDGCENAIKIIAKITLDS